MLHKFLATLIMCLVTPAVVLASTETPWEKKLPFKSATIAYAISGTQAGTETLYVRKYGAEKATYRETSMTMMGMAMDEKTVEIETPEWIYSFDLTEKSGVKSANPQKYMIEEYKKLSSADKKNVDTNIEKMGIVSAAAMGGKFEKKAADILGYTCDKVSMMGTTIYMIEGTSIPLKTESNVMGMVMSSVATSVDKGSVSDSYFENPKGIKPEYYPESDAEVRATAVHALEMLKDPEGFKPPEINGNRIENVPAEDKEQMEQAVKMLKGILNN